MLSGKMIKVSMGTIIITITSYYSNCACSASVRRFSLNLVQAIEALLRYIPTLVLAKQ